MAALTCKRWLSAFCSPNVWRKFTYIPPAPGLTGLQYDIQTYFIGRGIRTIGWHMQYLRFGETDDFFMLNRILILIAEFLEAHPVGPTSEDCDLDLLLPLEGTYFQGMRGSSVGSDPSDSLSDSEVEPPIDTEAKEAPLMVAGTSTEGPDPELAASINLAIKLQQREYLDKSSNSSSSQESGIDFHEPPPAPSSTMLSHSAPQRFPFRSFSTTSSEGLPRGRKYRRSASCRFPANLQAHLPYPPDTSRFPPPCIRGFSLDFHSDFDEATGVVYGSGGALFATICRVLYQLRGLRSLYLRNLFLSPDDARKMILEVSAVSGASLERCSLLHVSKLPLIPDRRSLPVDGGDIRDRAYQLETDQLLLHSGDLHFSGVLCPPRNQYWYMRDRRWLSARSTQLDWNPLADLASLFPYLRRLELALAQLTGPMLLRLVYQTPLSVLILFQTDMSPHWFDMPPDEIQREQHVVRQGSLENLVTVEPLGGFPDGGRCETGDVYMDWGADIPVRKRLGETRAGAALFEWTPIVPEFWREALLIRRSLQVTVKLRFLCRNASVDHLHEFAVPMVPAPVTSAVCVFGSGDQATSFRLFEQSLAALTRFSDTLTSLVLLAEVDLEAIQEKEKEQFRRPRQFARFQQRCPITPTKDVVAKPIDKQLLQLLSSCPHVSSLSLGGRLLNIHLTTFGEICRLLRSAAKCASSLTPVHARLNVDVVSVRLSGLMPESTSARDSGIFTELMHDCRGKEASPAAKERAAECFIAASLGHPRWRFMQSGEFRRFVDTC